MTVSDARALLQRLTVARLEAVESGRGHDAYVADLTAQIKMCHDALVGLAVTEIARFRAELSGPLRG